VTLLSEQYRDEARIGYWASQEQYSTQQLIEFTKEAEREGIITNMTSDHFHPWWHDGGYGNFTWVWIAAAAERTKKMQFVTGVTAAVYRYNPGIIAQAFASLDVLHPGRMSLGLGSGEAMNEVPLGFDWPDTKVRLASSMALALGSRDYLPPNASSLRNNEYEADAIGVSITRDLRSAISCLRRLSGNNLDAPLHQWELFDSPIPAMALGEKIHQLKSSTNLAGIYE
jgi:Luciferase-like monooxygenase